MCFKVRPMLYVKGLMGGRLPLRGRAGLFSLALGILVKVQVYSCRLRRGIPQQGPKQTLCKPWQGTPRVGKMDPVRKPRRTRNWNMDLVSCFAPLFFFFSKRLFFRVLGKWCRTTHSLLSTSHVSSCTTNQNCFAEISVALPFSQCSCEDVV